MAIYLKNKKGKGILCRNTRQPRYGSRGRSWDYTELKINGKKIEADIDTTWGKYFYFPWQGSWYKMVHWVVWTGMKSEKEFTIISKKEFDSIEKQDDLM